MTAMKTTMALLALTTLTACDDIVASKPDRDRADSTYRAAMSDYQAGRMPQAIDGFKKACVANPANASARFQLACLLQDSAKDYVGAFCAYREYLLQSPESEKAKLAADRLAVCEREMAKAFIAKHAPQAAQDALRRAQESKAAQTKAESEGAKQKSALEAANREIESLRQEIARLKKYMREDAEKDAANVQPVVSKDEIAAAKKLVSGDESATVVSSEDLAAAKRLVESDSAEPPPLLTQAPDAKARRDAAREAEKKAPAKAEPNLHEKRPETYVIQEGDTLYKLALRFYGRASAWNAIRNANKAVISTDGRLRKGQKIVLPDLDR